MVGNHVVAHLMSKLFMLDKAFASWLCRSNTESQTISQTHFDAECRRKRDEQTDCSTEVKTNDG